MVGSETTGSFLNLYVRVQYIQDKQGVTLNDRFGVHIGPSGDFSDIQVGMSEIGTKSDHPQVALDVLKAATLDIHIFIVMFF
jgi:hypothetical protein